MSVGNISETIIVLDFGGQYNQLITRRIRDLGVFSELHPNTISAEKIKELNPAGIIFSGGPNSAYVEGALTCDPAIFDLDIPILGICYGMQLMTLHYGGKVEKAQHREYGKAVFLGTNFVPVNGGAIIDDDAAIDLWCQCFQKLRQNNDIRMISDDDRLDRDGRLLNVMRL